MCLAARSSLIRSCHTWSGPASMFRIIAVGPPVGPGANPLQRPNVTQSVDDDAPAISSGAQCPHGVVDLGQPELPRDQFFTHSGSATRSGKTLACQSSLRCELKIHSPSKGGLAATGRIRYTLFGLRCVRAGGPAVPARRRRASRGTQRRISEVGKSSRRGGWQKKSRRPRAWRPSARSGAGAGDPHRRRSSGKGGENDGMHVQEKREG